MIVIFTHPDDQSHGPVAEQLTARGASFATLDPAQLQQQWWVKLQVDGPDATVVLEHAGGAISADQIGAVWWRRPGRPTAPASIRDPRVARYLELEAREHLAAMCHLIEATWLPARPHHVVEMQHKLPQLRAARRLGFATAATLVPSSADDVIAFWERHRGRVICKPLGVAAFDQVFGATLSRYCEPLSRSDLAHADSVARCPVILQAYVEKRSELRVTIVGDQVFAAEIQSQGSNHTRTDWRKYDRHATRYRPYELPSEVARRCLALTAELGLCYGAIDLIMTPQEDYVFLEINPAGEYNFIEQRTGLPISRAIAELLIAEDRHA